MLRLAATIAAVLAISCYVSAHPHPEVLEDEADQSIQPYIGEDLIHEMVKNLSENLAKSDPFLIRNTQVSLGNDGIKLDFEAEDILLRGFSRFTLTNVKVSAIQRKADFNLQFDEVQALVPYYKIDALAVFIPFYGSGTMNLVSTVIDVGGSVKLSLSGTIKELKIRFFLKESNLRVTGLLHNEPMSDIVSVATTECFPEFINTYGERLGDLVGGALVDVINGLLKPEEESTSAPATSGGDTVQIGPNTITYTYQL